MPFRSSLLAVCALAAGASVGQAPAQTAPTTAGVPTTATSRAARPLTDAELAEQVRGLVERAVKAKSPDEAARLMEEASRLRKQIRSDEGGQAAVFTFDPARVNLEHLVVGLAKSVKTERVMVLTERLRLVERGQRVSLPFTGMADNNKGFIIPVPLEHDQLDEQDLELDGKSIYVVRRPRLEVRFHASPDSRRVVLSDFIDARPMAVLDVSTGRTVSVPEPEGIDGHYNGYPLRFLRWVDDSAGFLAEATGSFFSAGRGEMAYREVWRVDAATGRAVRLSRTERPWAEDLKWDEPPSASGPATPPATRSAPAGN